MSTVRVKTYSAAAENVAFTFVELAFTNLLVPAMV